MKGKNKKIIFSLNRQIKLSVLEIFSFQYNAKLAKMYIKYNLDKVLNRYKSREIKRKRTAIKVAGIQTHTPTNKINDMSSSCEK